MAIARGVTLAARRNALGMEEFARFFEGAKEQPPGLPRMEGIGPEGALAPGRTDGRGDPGEVGFVVVVALGGHRGDSICGSIPVPRGCGTALGMTQCADHAHHPPHPN